VCVPHRRRAAPIRDYVLSAFYRRHLLPVGEALAGPAILLQKESTTVIPPGCSAFNDAAGNLVLKVAGDVR
jgi:N-methylhydantoinase A